MSAAIITAVFIFTLATLAGAEVINKVPPTLHTPLMSGANAVSGIALIGAILVAGGQDISTASILGFIAIILATINVVGGFLVTDRMLQMFKKKST
jgi:H+-translocating NAD(P) transhydrogenase subunit alpha